MRSWFRLGVCLVLAVVTSRAGTAAEVVKPIKVLFICGGCCHDYAAQKELLSKGLEARAHMEVTVVHQGGSSTNTKIPVYEDPDWAKGYDVVIHDECFADVKDPAWLQRILKPHQEGVPAVVLHCAMHCYRTGSDEWFKFCGVTSRGHGAQYPHEVLTRDGEHPIMKNAGAGWANPAGELYHIEKVWPTAHPLASSKNRENGKDEVCVWTNEYGKTRVFGSTLGHHNETVSHPAFLDLVTRGTLWACDKLTDDYLKKVEPQLAPVNLAKGKTATASSEETGKNNLVAHAVDGNPATRWCASDGSKPQWLQVDLGKTEKVTGVTLEWESDSAVYKYTLEGSTDGKSWQTLVDLSKSGEHGKKTHEFGPVELRYVKLTFLGTNTGAWGSVRELKVLGEEKVPVESLSSRNSAEEATLAEVKASKGFTRTLFAAPPAVNYPVFVAAAPNGDVFVASDKNGSLGRDKRYGSVFRLRDVDGDGRADESKRFVADVDSPRGLVWDHDRLYLMHPPHLSAFIDHDNDGIADEQKILVKNIAFNLKDRPADHTSNGVTLGIDGWLYLAIGDFGFMEAEGVDGKKLQLRGGGVVRVRPDGTGLELYSNGTRNILEVGVDPLLNGFTRDNTNDGGGWDIRLHHFSGLEDHGYPRLFKNFGDEVVQPLADYGGGSGCGTLYMDEPGFPEGFGNAMYTADWGRERVFRHRLTPKGATFTPDQAEFLTLPRVTDLDVDANGHIYAASWKGAVFNYNGENVGYLVRVSPEGYKPEPLADVTKLDESALIAVLKSSSHRRRMAAQREIVRRGIASNPAIAQLATNDSQPLATRIAALFCLKLGLREKSTQTLLELAKLPAIREYALRALTDHPDELKDVPNDPFVAALVDTNPRVRRQAAQSFARLGRPENAAALTALMTDEDPIVAHTAINALVALRAAEACLTIVDDANATSGKRAAALRVLASLHQPEIVAALITRAEKDADPVNRRGLLLALCRLHFIEGKWKGDSWGTRPDTTGPYYQPEPWSETPKIAVALQNALASAKGDEAAYLIEQLSRHRIKLDGSLERLIAMAVKDPTVLPAAVAQLAKSDAVPAAAVPLLVDACCVEPMDAAVRSQAVVAITRCDDSAAWRAALGALASLGSAGLQSAECRTARDALLGSARLDRFHDAFEQEAMKQANPASAWADAALLTISTKKDASPEAKAAVIKSLETGWNEPKRRAQILTAVALGEHRDSSEKVLAALKDTDPQVAAAAGLTAKRLNLTASPATAGPLVESMKVDEVIATVLQEKGDHNRGEQLFKSQLNCAKCHTLKADEPQKGPFLGNIADTYKRKELAEAILLPSKTIAQGFVTTSFILDDGTQLTGFVTQEAADKVTIRDSEAREHVIPVENIEARARQTISMMPDGQVNKLSVQDFTSLVEYLQSMKK